MVRLTDRPDMTLDVYRGCKTTTQQQQNPFLSFPIFTVYLSHPFILVSNSRIRKAEMVFFMQTSI